MVNLNIFYITNTQSFLKEWRKSYRTNYNDNNDSDVDEDEDDDIRFVIPGNEDYIPDKPWAMGTMEGDGIDNNELPWDVQNNNTLQRNMEGGYNMRKRKRWDNNSDDDTPSSDDDDMWCVVTTAKHLCIACKLN